MVEPSFQGLAALSLSQKEVDRRDFGSPVSLSCWISLQRSRCHESFVRGPVWPDCSRVQC